MIHWSSVTADIFWKEDSIYIYIYIYIYIWRGQENVTVHWLQVNAYCERLRHELECGFEPMTSESHRHLSPPTSVASVLASRPWPFRLRIDIYFILLQKAKILGVWPGLRPYRTPLRLESETRTYHGKPLKVLGLQWRHNGASQITSLTIVYSSVYSGTDQRKCQSSASLAFVWGIHRWPVNSPHKWPITRKMFPFGDVIMGMEVTIAFCTQYFQMRFLKEKGSISHFDFSEFCF